MSDIETLIADYQRSMKTAGELFIQRNRANEQASAVTKQYDEATNSVRAKRKAMIEALDAEVGVRSTIVADV